MQPVFIVVGSPSVDPGAGIFHAQEPGRVQAFLTETAVECFDIGVIGWFPGLGEVQFDLVQVRPLVEQSTSELMPIARREETLFTGYCHARNSIQRSEWS